MAQTSARRPSPLRKSSHPAYESPPVCPIDMPVPGANHRARPKSIIDRIWRNSHSALEQSEDFVEDHSGQPSTPHEGKNMKAKGARSGSTAWQKRASRKAPPTPNRSGSVPQPGVDHLDRLEGGMPELSRQPRNGSICLSRENEAMGLALEEEFASEKGFEMVGVVPKVFLHPPEEEDTLPIKLYPLPPPMTARPALIHLANSSSRPTSLYSMDSNLSETARNTWGGMASKFNKPAPVFKRGGRDAMAAGGVVMPKRREEVQRDRQRRISMYNPDDMDWRAGGDGDGPVSSPNRRASSPPVIAVNSFPGDFEIVSGVEARQALPGRAHSAPAVYPVFQSPPRIFVTSDSMASMASLTTEAAHSIETGETGSTEYFSLPPQSPLDDLGRSSTSNQDEPLVESPIAFASPELPAPLSSMEEMAEAARTSPAPPRPMPLPLVEEEEEEGVDRALFATSTPIDTARQQGSVTHNPNPAATAFLSDTIEPSTSNDALSQLPLSGSGTTRSQTKRRSMSLTSLVLAKPAEPAASVPPLPEPSLKTIRKHKSLKKFFFSSGDLAKEEREAVPRTDLRAIKEKLDRPRPASSVTAASLDGPDDLGQAKTKSAFGGMLSRPKSKPSLRIDVKASREPVPPAPMSAPSVSSAPTSAPSTATSSASETYPETPSSRVSSKSKPKSTPIQADLGGTKGLTKRFSLSNMSSAFRRSKRDLAGHIPQVPEVPTAYKMTQKRSKSSDAVPAAVDSRAVVKESAVPLSPRRGQLALDSPRSGHHPLLSPPASPGQSSQSHATDAMQGEPRRLGSPQSIKDALPPLSPKDTSSILSETSSTFELDEELDHAQLMLVSPRTRRNPVESLQDIMGVGPIGRLGTIVTMEPGSSRHSVEAIILGPLLMSPPLIMDTIPDIDLDTRRGSDQTVESRDGGYDSVASLETLSRSSSTSDPLDHMVVPVTPSSALANPLELPPPIPSLPMISAIPSDMIMVDAPSMEDVYHSPTSTVATSRRSPEGIFRFFSTGRQASPKSTISASRRGSTNVMPITTGFDFTASPPIVEGAEGYTTLSQDTQLRSLHFDSLGLDFDECFPASLMVVRRDEGALKA